MELSDTTIHQVELIDEVLRLISAPKLFENPAFLIDWASSGFYRLVINTPSKNVGTVPIILFLEGDGIRLDVAGFDEAFEWTTEEVFRSRDEVVLFFKRLFTSFVLVESIGTQNNKLRMYLFNTFGELVGKYCLGGPWFRFSSWESDKTLYFPFFSAERC
jgi:hypothetical protein